MYFQLVLQRINSWHMNLGIVLSAEGGERSLSLDATGGEALRAPYRLALPRVRHLPLKQNPGDATNHLKSFFKT